MKMQTFYRKTGEHRGDGAPRLQRPPACRGGFVNRPGRFDTARPAAASKARERRQSVPNRVGAWYENIELCKQYIERHAGRND